MDSDLVIGPLFVLITIFYGVTAIAACFAVFNGFYLSLNPSPVPLLRYLRNEWLKILLTMVPLVLLIWFTASHAAVYCGVKRESHTPETGYYFHRMSFYLPACGTVGVWSYGERPPRSVPGLTVGLARERVVLHSSLALYLIALSFITAWVCNYIWDERKKRRNASF